MRINNRSIEQRKKTKPSALYSIRIEWETRLGKCLVKSQSSNDLQTKNGLQSYRRIVYRIWRRHYAIQLNKRIHITVYFIIVMIIDSLRARLCVLLYASRSCCSQEEEELYIYRSYPDPNWQNLYVCTYIYPRAHDLIGLIFNLREPPVVDGEHRTSTDHRSMTNPREQNLHDSQLRWTLANAWRGVAWRGVD